MSHERHREPGGDRREPAGTRLRVEPRRCRKNAVNMVSIVSPKGAIARGRVSSKPLAAKPLAREKLYAADSDRIERAAATAAAAT